MKKSSLSTLLLFLVVVVMGQSRKENELIDRYLDVAYDTYFQQSEPLYKWSKEQSIKYYIHGSYGGFKEKDWNRFLEKISICTGLIFERVEEKEQAQIDIFFMDIEQYVKIHSPENLRFLKPRMPSWRQRKYDKDFILQKASYCIDTKKLNSLKYARFLIKQNFLRCLGLAGDVDDSTSIFHKYFVQYNDKMSLMDRRCLAIHYSEELNFGIQKEEVKEVVMREGVLERVLGSKFK